VTALAGSRTSPGGKSAPTGVPDMASTLLATCARRATDPFAAGQSVVNIPGKCRDGVPMRITQPPIHFRLTGWSSTARASMTLVMLGLSVPASASLGGDLSSVQTDQARMRGAVIQIVNGNAYTVHEMRAASGTTVREFVSPAGTVFAVAWQGPSIPDLRQVLGMYFAPYAQAAQAAQRKRAGHGPLKIEQPGLVVEQSGHPRAFAGRAYVPQFMPAGLGPDVIR
jgi:hypothetical protein